MVGRLVEQQRLRRREQHTRQRQARFLPAAERLHGQVGRQIAQPQPGQHSRRTPSILICQRQPRQHGIVFMLQVRLVWLHSQRLGQFAQPFRKRMHVALAAADVLFQRLTGQKCQPLCQIAHPQICGRPLHRARIGPLLTSNDAQQGGLAAAVRPHKAHALACLHAKCHILKNRIQSKGFRNTVYTKHTTLYWIVLC